MSHDVQTNSVIGVALTSPVWASMLSNVNEILTVVLTALGIVLTLVKLYQAIYGNKGKSDE